MSALISDGSCAKIIFFELCKNSLIRKTRRKSSIFKRQSVKTRGSLSRNARFGASTFQAGRSFLRFAWQAQYFRSVSIE